MKGGGETWEARWNSRREGMLRDVRAVSGALQEQLAHSRSKAFPLPSLRAHAPPEITRFFARLATHEPLATLGQEAIPLVVNGPSLCYSSLHTLYQTRDVPFTNKTHASAL